MTPWNSVNVRQGGWHCPGNPRMAKRLTEIDARWNAANAKAAQLPEPARSKALAKALAVRAAAYEEAMA